MCLVLHPYACTPSPSASQDSSEQWRLRVHRQQMEQLQQRPEAKPIDKYTHAEIALSLPGPGRIEDVHGGEGRLMVVPYMSTSRTKWRPMYSATSMRRAPPSGDCLFHSLAHFVPGGPRLETARLRGGMAAQRC